MGAALRGIGHVARVTRDFERLAGFYARVFGAEASPRSDNDRRAGLGFIRIGGGVALHAFERRDGPLGAIDDAAAGRPLARGRIDHLSLEAVDLDSFVAARGHLIELSASDGAVVDFGPLVSLFFEDPDGRQLELSLTKGDDWAPPFGVRPFTPRRPD